jgi:hypothetical protein
MDIDIAVIKTGGTSDLDFLRSLFYQTVLVSEATLPLGFRPEVTNDIDHKKEIIKVETHKKACRNCINADAILVLDDRVIPRDPYWFELIKESSSMLEDEFNVILLGAEDIDPDQFMLCKEIDAENALLTPLSCQEKNAKVSYAYLAHKRFFPKLWDYDTYNGISIDSFFLNYSGSYCVWDPSLFEMRS